MTVRQKSRSLQIFLICFGGGARCIMMHAFAHGAADEFKKLSFALAEERIKVIGS
jgi:hypothetical protein